MAQKEKNIRVKKEKVQFEDGEKIEFPVVEEKKIVEGIILPKKLFSDSNELIHPLKLKEPVKSTKVSKVIVSKGKKEKPSAKKDNKPKKKEPVKLEKKPMKGLFSKVKAKFSLKSKPKNKSIKIRNAKKR
ncbi:MAG: hypothetical protein WC755_05595 [Candidatus Woesearchaeota archaeon]